VSLRAACKSMWLSMWNGKRRSPVFGLFGRATTGPAPTGTTNQDSSPSRSRRRRGAGTRTRIGPMSRRVRSGHGSGAGAGSARPRRRGPQAIANAPNEGAKPKAAPRAGGGAVPGAIKNGGTESRLIVSYERTTLEITAPARRRQQRRAWISDRIRELEQERLHSARGAWHRCLACELLQVQEPHHRTAA